MPETDLYPPLKSFLEKQGYTVKAEVGAADIVALRGIICSCQDDDTSFEKAYCKRFKHAVRGADGRGRSEP